MDSQPKKAHQPAKGWLRGQSEAEQRVIGCLAAQPISQSALGCLGSRPLASWVASQGLASCLPTNEKAHGIIMQSCFQKGHLQIKVRTFCIF